MLFSSPDLALGMASGFQVGGGRLREMKSMRERRQIQIRYSMVQIRYSLGWVLVLLVLASATAWLGLA